MSLLNSSLQILKLEGPDTLTTAIPPTPGGVLTAQMVSLLAIALNVVQILLKIWASRIACGFESMTETVNSQLN